MKALRLAIIWLLICTLSTLALPHPSQATVASQPARQQIEQRSAPGVVNLAKSLVGKPYLWGGATPSGFDTSGFVFYVYKNSSARLQLPRTCAEQFKKGKAISLKNLRPGDLHFFRINGKIQGVGIFIGNGKFITATSKGIRVQSLKSKYWIKHYIGAKRVIGYYKKKKITVKKKTVNKKKDNIIKKKKLKKKNGVVEKEKAKKKEGTTY